MSKIEVTPKISEELLTNPGIGFIAAPGLMKPQGEIYDNSGKRVSRYQFTENSLTYNHPDSKVFYCGVKWKDLEPRRGVYRFHLLEEKLETAKKLGCTAVVRCMPYALGEDDDIPQWFREEYPEEPEFPFWRIDPENTPYTEYWAEFIHAFAEHFDGHPYISSVDMALVGAWGEGGGTEFVSEEKIEHIIDAYLSNFKLTPVQSLLHDPMSNRIIKDRKVPVGFRVDCLGDLGGFHGQEWSHMLDFYPQNIQNFEMGDAWKKAPVLFEACWHMNDWFLQGWDIDYIIEESLKWHISSYNSKGTTVPEEWKDSVTRWLKKMGYRFELRRVRYDREAVTGKAFEVSTHWVNTGVAPIYAKYPLKIRLRNKDKEFIFVSTADIRTFLPEEDVFLLESYTLPEDAPAGIYTLEVGIDSELPEIGMLNLAVEGQTEGYYPVGEITVRGEAI